VIDDRLLAKPVQEIPFGVYKFWQFRAFLSAHFHFYQLARQWWHAKDMEVDAHQLSAHVADQIRQELGGRSAKGWRMTYELLKKIRETGEQIDATMAVFLIPLSIQLDEVKLAAFIDAHNLSRDSISLYKPQQLMQEFGKAEKIEMIDLLPFFREWQIR